MTPGAGLPVPAEETLVLLHREHDRPADEVVARLPVILVFADREIAGVDTRRQRASAGEPPPPYAVYNVGCGMPVNLLAFITTLQEELVRAGILPEDYDFEAHRELVGMQPGDVPYTNADCRALEEDFGFRPHTGIREGLRRFAQWYRAYYRDASVSF